MQSNVIDQPAKAEEDKLHLSAYAEALADFLREAKSPLTVALQGEWGSGKTSLMKALEARLVSAPGAPYLGVWINTWQYALMSDPATAILNILAGIVGQVSAVAGTTAEDRTQLLCKIARVGGSVFSDIFKKYSGVDLDAKVKEWGADKDATKSSIEDLKDELAARVNAAIKSTESTKGKSGFLFFIDDLDRIDPPAAVQILELLKNVFDLENCIFILAIDYGVVVKGLKPKFGAMTEENEREFRSFFDKIIQLPFSMPVASYKIDDFLTESLTEIGYLDAKEKDNTSLTDALTAYALDTVGTNPRSLKRLINYLSLIRILIVKTPEKTDDANFVAWKDVLFALVSLQIQYPKVYDALQKMPDFPSWDTEFEQQMRLPALTKEETEKLSSMPEFDEPWEQMLFRFCHRDPFLESRALHISRILNRIKDRIEKAGTSDGDTPAIGETIEWLLRLSAVTSVKSEPAIVNPAEFSKSQYLKDLRDNTLGMRWIDELKRHAANLSDTACLSSDQRRVQSNFTFYLWKSTVKGTEDCQNYLCQGNFQILRDEHAFQLKINGEFWGNTPEKHFSIDFSDEIIQTDLASAENAYCDAWKPFGVNAQINANIGHSPRNIWWNIMIPFKNHDELVSPDFSQKLRGSLTAVATAFATLLTYRVPVQD